MNKDPEIKKYNIKNIISNDSNLKEIFPIYSILNNYAYVPWTNNQFYLALLTIRTKKKSSPFYSINAIKKLQNKAFFRMLT